MKEVGLPSAANQATFCCCLISISSVLSIDLSAFTRHKTTSVRKAYFTVMPTPDTRWRGSNLKGRFGGNWENRRGGGRGWEAAEGIGETEEGLDGTVPIEEVEVAMSSRSDLDSVDSSSRERIVDMAITVPIPMIYRTATRSPRED